MLKTAGTVTLLLALAVAGVALAAQPVAKTQSTTTSTTTTTTKKKTTHTAAGMAAAAHAVLVRGDLGAGWLTGKPGPADASPTCSSAGLGAGVVETGRAASSTFSQGTAGPFVSQVVFVYGTVSQAKQVWQRTAGKTALDCLAQSVRNGATKTTRFTILHKQTLESPQAGTRSAAYRVVADAVSKSPAQTIDVYFDLLLVGKGNAVTLISYADFQEPLARSVEVAVARALARRL